METPIIGNAFSLSFDTTKFKGGIGTDLDIGGEQLMNRLVAKGFVAFQLEWEGKITAQLAIEDDVIFLCEAVEELTRFARGESPSHHVHLGDGELEVTSTLDSGVVSMAVVHTPHLDSRFRREYAFEASIADYLSAWGALVRDLGSRA